MPDRERGKVKWFNDAKGFGFITRENAPDVFVHYSELCEVGQSGKIETSKGFKSLADGDAVEFIVVQGTKGLAASKVTKVVS